MSSRETQLALQIDTGVKEMAKVVLKASGLTVRDAGNDLLTRVISSDDIPFVVSRDPELRAIGITETMRRHFGLDGKEWPIASGDTKPMCIHLDKGLFEAAQKKLDDYGVPPATLFRAFLSQCAYEMRLPY